MSGEVTNKGVICIHETNGKAQLYGSKVNHFNYMTLYIRKASGGDSMDPFDRVKSSGDSLIEVHLSLLQFAEMICSIGKGEGTPCTIRSLMGERLPKYVLPDQKQSLLKYASGLDNRNLEKLQSSKELLKSKLNSNKKLTKEDMHNIISAIESFESDRSNLKFIAERTEEVFEKAVSEAKNSLDKKLSNIENKMNNETIITPFLEHNDQNT